MTDRALSLLLLVLLLSLLGCGVGQKGPATPRTGAWRMELDLNGRRLPFQFDLSRDDSARWVAHIHNASEEILVTDIVLHNDTILIRMPLFDSEFKGIVRSDSVIDGTWHNYLKGPEYRIPFVANAGALFRFPGPSDGKGAIAGTWEVHFSKGTPDVYNAIGLFEQHADGRATGTFVTETGDYRYLEGAVNGDSLKLSCFDGSRAFLFTAALQGDSLVGRYWSGTHWEEPWVAYRNPDYRLRNPDSLTFLKEGYDMVDFRFPDLDGKPVSPSDDRYKGKVLMVQVMGSWCPNCVDETVLLKEMHKTYGDKGLEMIAVAFEKYDEPERAIAGLKRFRKALGVDYPIVYGGPASKENAGDKLPFLDHVMSYPTCIFVDRNGMVRRIHTGFYGPGTGEHYANYRSNLHTFLELLLAEPVMSAVAPKKAA
ncbi:MAG: TlpA family protein disulfide reductase [Flavobacteriales bacterium]|nr:TlpA family protein disulfide reductase [Flavobacteriales bacterium]